MTELMKRYCKENSCCHTTISAYGLTMQTPAYVAWLEAQLTWRPVSEPPKESGYYLVRLKIDDMSYPVVSWFDGEDFDTTYRVICWLPIPPAPKGE